MTTSKPKRYYWTEQKINWQGVGLLEVATCVDLGEGHSEQLEGLSQKQDFEAQGLPIFYSVYVWREGQGADCIADRPTQQQALGLADAFSRNRGLEIKDYTV